MAENLVEFGLKNVHIATLSLSGSTVVYGTPVALPGAVNLTLAPEGDKTEFYADDKVYYTKTKNKGYSGSLEVARLTNWFRTNILKEVVDSNYVYTEDADADMAAFALLFEIDGDANKTLFAYYNVQPSRPAGDAASKTNVDEPKTNVFDISCLPASDTEFVRARTSESTSTTISGGWYSTVYVTTAS